MGFKFLDYLDKYPPAIARENITDFFKWLPAKTLSHLESRGEGPSGAFYIGKKKLYPTFELLEWLDSRAEADKNRSVEKNNNDLPSDSCRRGRKTKKQAVSERRG